jgi:hypothetical protein
MSDFAPWQEWGERCDSTLCSENTRAELHKFARINWSAHLDGEAGGGDVPEAGEVTGKEPWERFESYCAVKKTSEGKSTKSWLFMRLSLPSGKPADKIRSGASGIIRSVVREFLRREGRFRLPGLGRPQPSLDDDLPRGTEGDSLSLHDLLPDIRDPNKQAEFRELEELAVTEAGEIMSELTERQRIAITAKVLGLALSNPEVERIAGCKKSVLSAELDKARRAIKRKIHDDYPDERARRRSEFGDEVRRAICRMCAKPKNQPEMWEARLFSLAVENEQ